jgi:creatinine amidohydrolase/Fe(II)-dependent formamide hydrolase-like protein
MDHNKFVGIGKCIVLAIGSASLLIPVSSPQIAWAQEAPPAVKDSAPPIDVVEIDLLTWPELYKEIHEQGKTAAIVYNGSTEQCGPQDVVGGHSIIAKDTADSIARKLGNALVAPVLPFALNRADPSKPGTIGITSEIFTAVNQQVAEQLIRNGFKNIVLIGDHGGGQKKLHDLALKLDEQCSPQGVRVIYSDGPYTQANNEFDAWLAKKGYPASAHGGIPDTSELLYLEGNTNRYVRKNLLATALGDPVPHSGGEDGPAGDESHPSGDGAAQTSKAPHRQRQQSDPNTPRINNGIIGDARRSTAALGRQFIDLKVDDGVKQIQQLLSQPPVSASK